MKYGVLFTDGNWRIVGNDVAADIQHHCVQPHGGREWWYYAYDGTCGICHAGIPVELIGLRNLHEWKR